MRVYNVDKVMKAMERKRKALSRNRVIQRVLINVALPLVKEVRANAPNETLKNAYGFITRKDNKYPNTILIGPNYSVDGGGQLSHIFEYGTAVRKTRDGSNRGFIKAVPYIRPAFDKYKQQIATQVGDKITKIVTENK
jgi:hypothetical protein